MTATPILDLERDPPKSENRRSWIATVFAMAVGAALALGLSPQLISLDPLWCLPFLYASIAFHEIGHLAAAKICGMQTGGISVGGFTLFRSGDRWLRRFSVRSILGGFALPLPTRPGATRAEHAWMVAGGPLATILLAAICGIAILNSSHPPAWLTTLWWINVILCFCTLIPPGGVNKSDAARLWMFLRDPRDAESWVALVRLQAQETIGVLPRDWDPELVAQLLDYRRESGDTAYRRMLAFYRAVDLSDPDAALNHLETALAASGRCGLAVRHWCFGEAACSSAMLRHNPAAARVWLERARKLRKLPSSASIEAGIAQAEGRYTDAIRLWDEALAFVEKRRIDSGLVRFVKVLMARYRAECVTAAESQKAATLSP